MSAEKKIDVIVPVYNAHKYLPRLLHSLCTQSCKDQILVTLVDDCSEQGYRQIVKRFKDELDINTIRLNKNSGPGAARQYGIDNTNLPYITFIDSDDTLATSYSLAHLLFCIEEDDHTNVVTSDFVEMKDATMPMTRFDSATWMFGKMFKRKFLQDHNIRFELSRCNEDAAFNLLCGGYDMHKYMNEITYIWEYNEHSITETDDYSYYSTEFYVDSHVRLKKRREIDKTFYADEKEFQQLLIQSFVYLFFSYNLLCDGRPQEDKDKFIGWVRQLTNTYSFVMEQDQVLYVEKFMGFMGSFGMSIIPWIGMEDFIKLLKKDAD